MNQKFLVIAVAITVGAFGLGWLTTTIQQSSPTSADDVAALSKDGQSYIPEGVEPSAGTEEATMADDVALEDDAAPAPAPVPAESIDPEAIADESADQVPAEEAADVDAGTESATASDSATEGKTRAEVEAAYEANPLTSTRSIGSPDAPVVMEEFSSLTCPHCASFHEELLPLIKKDYVDTGKLRIIFRDYPLNRPALEASVVARCLAPDQYYGFISVLFETQGEWAFEANANKLHQTAKLAGLSEEQLDTCINDASITKFIASNVQKYGALYNIRSTPTFVFNNGEFTIKGNRPVAEFTAELDRLVEEAKK